MTLILCVSKKNMKVINSPIVITIIVIVSAFTLKSQMKPDFASEIRGAYDELISIAQDASGDAEKTKAIQDFAEQIASQLKTGFSSGFSSKDDEESRDEKFLRIKKNVHVTGVKEIQSEWKGRQAIMFRLENKSEYAISQIKVNLEFYRNGELVDVKNEHIHDIEVLDSGESFTAKEERNTPNHLTEEEKAGFAFDQVTVAVTSFQIVE